MQLGAYVYAEDASVLIHQNATDDFSRMPLNNFFVVFVVVVAVSCMHFSVSLLSFANLFLLRQLHSHLIRFSEHLLLVQNHNCICDSLNKPSIRIMPINV